MTTEHAAWFAHRSHAYGITQFYEPAIDVFYRCNLWLVRGRGQSLLFDSGLGVVSLVGQYPWLLDEPVLAVASHTHFDHIGNHHEFSARACHPAEASILANPTRDATLATRYATLAMFERLPPGGFCEDQFTVVPAPATRLLEEGDVIDLGNRTLQVLHVPGHSPGSLALWEPNTGVLLSGDAVYDGPLIDDAYHSHPEDYRATMARLRNLPVTVVHGGHYPSFGRDRFHSLIDDYLAGRRASGCPSDFL